MRIKSFESFLNENTEQRFDEAIFKSLCGMWRFEPNDIKRVFIHIGQGRYFDPTNEYLELMDSLTVTDPAEAWNDWCINIDEEHEMDNNPFI